MEQKDLLPLETKWLDSRGGRTVKDVYLDEDNKKYVVMKNASGLDVRVYIPDNDTLRKIFNINFNYNANRKIN